jgi:hypothetical protein
VEITEWLTAGGCLDEEARAAWLAARTIGRRIPRAEPNIRTALERREQRKPSCAKR